jgi:hypothetical protein
MRGQGTRSPSAPLGSLALVVFLVLAGSSACTVFDDLSASQPTPLVSSDGGQIVTEPPPQQGDGGSKGADAGGGPTACVDLVSQGTNAYLTVEDAAKVCALVPTCDASLALSLTSSLGVTLGTGDYSSCMQWLAGSIPSSRIGVPEQKSILQCLVGKSCTDAISCLPFEVLAGGDSRCADRGTGVFCSDPNTVVDCGAMLVSHCQQPLFGQGATCQTGSGIDETGKAVTISECAVGTCSCDQSGCTSPTACLNGNTMEICDLGALSISYDCSLAGYACIEQDSNGGVGLNCASDGTQVRQCNAVGFTQCEGNVAMVCDGAQFSEFDCGAEGATCSTEGGPAHCVRTSDRCNFYDQGINACQGSSVTLCIDGAPGCFDCGSIGMRCAADATTGLARCAP